MKGIAPLLAAACLAGAAPGAPVVMRGGRRAVAGCILR